MFFCPDCAPDDFVPLQLAANARVAVLGLLTFSLLLVLAVVVAGACLKYTRRLLLGGAVLLGIGLGTIGTGILFQRGLPWFGITPASVTGSFARRTDWLWQGDFYVFAFAAVGLGLVVVFTESRNVMAATRNRLVPAGVLAGWGLLSLASSIWLHRTLAWLTFEPSSTVWESTITAWLVGIGIMGGALVVLGVFGVVSVLRHPKPQKVLEIQRATRHAKHHAH